MMCCAYDVFISIAYVQGGNLIHKQMYKPCLSGDGAIGDAGGMCGAMTLR
jgi:hypothetical protein